MEADSPGMNCFPITPVILWENPKSDDQTQLQRIDCERQFVEVQFPGKKTLAHRLDHCVNWSDPLYFYGSDADQIKKQMNGSAGQWISESLRIHKMQVRWAVEHEMARTVEDVLSRRTRSLFLDAAESIRLAPVVANLMAEALNKDQEWVNQQVEEFTQLAQQYILKQN